MENTFDKINNVNVGPNINVCIITHKVYRLYIQTSLIRYSQTSLIRAPLVRMPHTPNTLPSNLRYHFLLQWFRNPHVSQSEHILMGTKLFG